MNAYQAAAPTGLVHWWSGTAMGTVVQLCLVAVDQPTEATARAEAILEEVEAELSAFRPASDVSRLNAAAGSWIPVGPHLEPVAAAAERHRELSGGAFAAVTGGSEAGPVRPLRFRDRGGVRQARLEPDARLDLGGIAKGYAADLVRDSVGGGQGVLVSVGTSSISVLGRPPERRCWRVGLRSPWQQLTESVGYLEVPSGSFSMSGISGYRIGSGPAVPGHIVDPRSGLRPRTDLCAVGVLSDSGVCSEAWSTAFLVLGLDQSLRSCRQYEVEALFLTTAGQLLTTPGLADQVSVRSGITGTLAAIRG